MQIVNTRKFWALQDLQLNLNASCNVKVDSLTFINFQENYQLKLPKYISTYIMLLHSIKQYLISVN